MNDQVLFNLLILVTLFALLLSIYLFFLLFKIQRKLRSVLASENPSQPYSLHYYLDLVDKQKMILNLKAASRSFSNPKQLSEVLQEISVLCYKLFNCEFIELSLVDVDTEIYHSACTVGTPVAGSSRGSFHQEIKPINFSGRRFGVLRIVLKKNVVMSQEERDLLDLLVLQAAIAILNARYSDELLKLRIQSEESVRAKTGFLANLSHELRGPLGIMLNAVEIMLSGITGEISEQQKQTLSMVKKNGDHLLDLINDVLDYSKVEAGKITPDIQPIIVEELINDVGKLVNSQALKKKHKFNFYINDPTLVIACDRRHARQILINLLTNAIKYTPQGGYIEFWGERSPGNKVKISVKDNGVGIPEKQQDKVFAAFERIDDQYSKKQTGTGLGLSLTVKLVEANGGKIGFESEQGRGSTFWVVFSTLSKSDAIIAEEPEKPEPKKANGQKLLLLEPSEEDAAVVQQYLESLGYQIDVMNEANLKSISTSDCSLILIENSLLDDLGSDFIENLRGNLSQKSLPVILMTSRAFDFDVEHYLKMGVDICVNKPFELSDLALKIQELV